MQVEGITFSNISATTAPFILRGGGYVITEIATLAPTPGFSYLQRLGPDGVTYQNMVRLLPLNPAFTGYSLPAGQYRINVGSGTTAVYIEIVRA